MPYIKILDIFSPSTKFRELSPRRKYMDFAADQLFFVTGGTFFHSSRPWGKTTAKLLVQEEAEEEGRGLTGSLCIF